ncbi:MAG: hypothetical protein ACR2N9_08980 [Acidimicrobiia bacterium]
MRRRSRIEPGHLAASAVERPDRAVIHRDRADRIDAQRPQLRPFGDVIANQLIVRSEDGESPCLPYRDAKTIGFTRQFGSVLGQYDEVRLWARGSRV